jgi:hypothetical protein
MTAMLTKPAAFDPDTVSLLGAVLEQAIAKLPPDGRSQERKTLLASKLLSAASAGERDLAGLYGGDRGHGLAVLEECTPMARRDPSASCGGRYETLWAVPFERG